jgi:hypothetical protein
MLQTIFHPENVGGLHRQNVHYSKSSIINRDMIDAGLGHHSVNFRIDIARETLQHKSATLKILPELVRGLIDSLLLIPAHLCTF